MLAAVMLIYSLIFIIVTVFIFFVVTKLFKFKNNTFKNHAKFWLIGILFSVGQNWLFSSLWSALSLSEQSSQVFISISKAISAVLLFCVIWFVFKESVKKSVLAALALLVILLVLYFALPSAITLGLTTLAANDDSDSKQNYNIIKQEGRVQFTLGDRSFDVPAGNFKGGGETAGGTLIHATLWGLLPNFEGYDKAKNHDEFIRLGNGRVARISLSSRLGTLTVPLLIERWINYPEGSALNGRLEDYDDIRYGLQYYTHEGRRKDIYLYVKDGEPTVLITCPSEKVRKTRSSPSCSYKWDLSEDTTYTMVHSFDYLPQWREIWEQGQQLINGQK